MRQSFESSDSIIRTTRRSRAERKHSQSIIIVSDAENDDMIVSVQQIGNLPQPISKPSINPIWNNNYIIKEELIEFSVPKEQEDSNIKLR